MLNQLPTKQFALQPRNQASVIKILQPISGKVLQKVLLWTTARVEDLLEGPEPANVKGAIKSLVAANVLRYDARGNVTWHSRI